jgi:hypothetical protein
MGLLGWGAKVCGDESIRGGVGVMFVGAGRKVRLRMRLRMFVVNGSIQELDREYGLLEIYEFEKFN